MTQRRVFRRIVSEDGRAIAEASSEMNVSDDTKTIFHQSVTVIISSNGTTQSVSSSASSSSSSSS